MNNGPKVIVAIVVERDGKLLLVKEILESGKEYWIFPGGKVEFGESLVDAARREIKEETGLDVEILRFIDFREQMNLKYGYHTIIFFFLGKPLSEKLILEEKILEAEFFTADETKSLNLIDNARWIMEKYFNSC
jgi:ADP-ribose pyrophosphatase YjhB (NUDIX family)